MKKFDKIYLATFIVIIGLCSVLTGQHHTVSILNTNIDTFYVSLIASLVGVLYVFGVRMNNKYSMVLGVIFSLLYACLAFTNKNYGDASINIYCSVICTIGFINWSKAERNKDSELKQLSKQGLFKIFIFTLVLYAILLFILNKMGSHNLWIDALITSLVLVSNTLMSLKYKELWLFFNLLNALHCILWSIRIYEGVPNALPILIMYILYLSNSCIASLDPKNKLTYK